MDRHWTDNWPDNWTDNWIDKQTDKWKDKWTDKERQIFLRINGKTNGQTKRDIYSELKMDRHQAMYTKDIRTWLININKKNGQKEGQND